MFSVSFNCKYSVVEYSCEKCMTFADGRVGGVVSIDGIVGAAAKMALEKCPPTWEVKGILSVCSLTLTLA